MKLEKWLEDFRKNGIEVRGTKLGAFEWISERKKAYEFYRPKFQKIDETPKEEIAMFLKFENNKSWTGLERRGGEALYDFEAFRKSAKFLLDENVSVKERVEKVVDSFGDFHVPGLGQNFATAILHVCYPEKYGILNNAVVTALQRIDREPGFTWGEGIGGWYEKVNERLNEIAKELGIDLIEVDSLMYYIFASEERPKVEAEAVAPLITVPSEDEVLRPLIVENLDKLFPNFELFVDEDGNEGVNYNMPGAGRPDIVCIDKNTGDLVVIELKKGRSDEVVIGQIQKYLGWAMENLCRKDQNTRGIIIVKEVDEKLRLAVLPVRNLISLKTYTLDVRLRNSQM